MDSTQSGEQPLTSRLTERLLSGLVAVGVALRLWQYFAGASLVLGEIALARNLTERSFVRLLAEPLSFDQNAAYGYLLILKATISTFGTGELAMRLVPALAGMAALALFVRLARQVIAGPPLLVAVAVFALGVPFLVYTGQIKPYGTMEVAVSLAYSLLALDWLASKPDRRAIIRTGIGGLCLLWLAQSAILTAIGVGVALAVATVIRQRSAGLRPLAPVLGLWGLGAIASVLSSFHTTDAEGRATFRSLYVGGYLPPFPHLKAQVVWFWRMLTETAGSQFHYWLPEAFIVAVGLGAFWLFRRNLAMWLVLLGPVVTAVFASAIGFYPFRLHYLLFVFPAFFVLAGVAVDQVWRFLGTRAKPADSIWIAGWLAVPILALVQNPPVYRIQETKTVLAHVRDRRQTGDAIYVYFGARQAITYYGPRYGFTPADFVFGECHRGQPRAYLREIDQFRGRPRVWALFTHDRGRLRERAEVLNYLNRIGTVRDSIAIVGPPVPPFSVGAFGYLYDLSDATRLSSATSENAPLLQEVTPDPRFPCSSGPIAAE